MDSIRGRERLLITRHRNHAVADPRALRRAVRTGEMLRLRSGAYVRSGVWAALTLDEQHRLEIAAALDASSSGLVVVGRSAAAIWGVPLLGRHDGLVHVRTSVAAGTRTEHGFRKHATAHPEQHVVEAAGVHLTSPSRTVVDLALSEPFASGVVAVDWALRTGVGRDELRSVLDEVAPKQRRAHAERAVVFGDGRSGSAGESWSRAQMEEAGLVMPVLQERFTDRHGLIGFVDFYWPQYGLVGEFDGIAKLTDPGMLDGRSPRQALAAEKRREDRLRSSDRHPSVTRWLWEVLEQRGRLPALLMTAGVRRRWTSGP
jgi:hypothetical protein